MWSSLGEVPLRSILLAARERITDPAKYSSRRVIHFGKGPPAAFSLPEAIFEGIVEAPSRERESFHDAEAFVGALVKAMGYKSIHEPVSHEDALAALDRAIASLPVSRSL